MQSPYSEVGNMLQSAEWGVDLTHRKLLIVADVDGTFIDANGRAPCTAGALAHHLQRIGERHRAECSLAFASSRTLPELVVLQRQFGLLGACIAEDGAVLAVDAGEVTHAGNLSVDRASWSVGRRRLAVWTLGECAARLRAELGDIIAPHELDPTDAVQMAHFGFRTRGAARRAITARRASILLDLHGRSELVPVREAAARAQAQLHSGGRWHTLTRRAGKGPAVNLLRRLSAEQQPCTVRIIGIGNEENDVSLLAYADTSFAIRNVRGGVHPHLAAVSGAQALHVAGTAGFIEMLERLTVMPIFDQEPE